MGALAPRCQSPCSMGMANGNRISCCTRDLSVVLALRHAISFQCCDASADDMDDHGDLDVYGLATGDAGSALGRADRGHDVGIRHPNRGRNLSRVAYFAICGIHRNEQNEPCRTQQNPVEPSEPDLFAGHDGPEDQVDKYSWKSSRQYGANYIDDPYRRRIPAQRFGEATAHSGDQPIIT